MGQVCAEKHTTRVSDSSSLCFSVSVDRQSPNQNPGPGSDSWLLQPVSSQLVSPPQELFSASKLCSSNISPSYSHPGRSYIALPPPSFPQNISPGLYDLAFLSSLVGLPPTMSLEKKILTLPFPNHWNSLLSYRVCCPSVLKSALEGSFIRCECWLGKVRLG